MSSVPDMQPVDAVAPVLDGPLRQLFEATPDGVVVLQSGRVVLSNALADRFFGVSGAAIADVVDLPGLCARVPTVGMHRVTLWPHGVADLVHRSLPGFEVMIIRDVTPAVRRAEGLKRIVALSRELVSSEPSVPAVLQYLVSQAKLLCPSDYSAVLLLREDACTETSHFAYDAPRHLFPTSMPRAVGLLAVPIATKAATRLEDIREHPDGAGLPGVHPPIGPLLAVPVLSGADVLGELAVANAPGGRVFDEIDEQLLQDLAAHVAVAVRWAQQAERVREEDLLQQEVIDAARHDIRTPLGAGKGYATLLLRKLDQLTPEQVATALAGVVGAFERIESFTERLLVDERQQMIGVQPQWELLDIAAMLRSVQRDAAATTGHPALQIELQRDAPTQLAGDPTMVREIIDNLVGNALRHSPRDVMVTVSVRREGRYARMDVRDEGPGIPDVEQGALFERWTRTDSSRSRQVPGFGLGLSIVKRLVSAHGGTLGLSSRPGEGATFWVTFPTDLPP